MRRRQQMSPHDDDSLPQTMEQAQAVTARKRRKKRRKYYGWSGTLGSFRKTLVIFRRSRTACWALEVAFLLCVGLVWTQRKWRHDAGSTDLVLPLLIASRKVMFNPSKLHTKGKREHNNKDYGGLQIQFLETDDGTRVIYHEHGLDEGVVLTGLGDDNVDSYYAFDDDVKRNPYTAWEDDKIQDEKHCRRTSWHRDLYLNCNSFHEFNLLDTFVEGESKYLGAGAYRQVYRSDFWSESIIFKICQWDDTLGNAFNYEDVEDMRKDMVVAERFTSNPYFVDIYGFCGLSMFSELMPYGDLDEYASPTYERGMDLSFLNDTADVQPLNNIDPSEKLIISLQMAEAIAFLHNYRGGVIVHDDIQGSQFLMTSDGEDKVFNSSDLVVKLNDFNRAEVMLFDEEHQEYCRYRNGAGNGDWRAPEEYFNKPLNEKIDVWSLGCNMYMLLTGMDPFYDLKKRKDVQEAVKAGKKAFIDPRYRTRSYAEGKIAEAIDLCWEYDPDKRTDIGTLVKLLQEAVKENDRVVK